MLSQANYLRRYSTVFADVMCEHIATLQKTGLE
jgi:hypothetical protein